MILNVLDVKSLILGGCSVCIERKTENIQKKSIKRVLILTSNLTKIDVCNDVKMVETLFLTLNLNKVRLDFIKF